MKISEAIKPLSASNAAIKNAASPTPKEGWYPAYSASGQDVWLPDYRFDKKGIVVSAVGARCGKAFKADGKWNVCANTHPLYVDETKALRDYCWYMINNEGWWIKGGTAQPFVKIKDSLDREHCFPTIQQQQIIIDRLDSIKNIIKLKEKQLEDLSRLIDISYVELFGNHKETILSNYISSLEAGKSLASLEECDNKVLKTGAVSYDYFDGSQTKYLPKEYKPMESHRVKKSDVIISRMNTVDLVGAAAYVWGVSDNIFLPDRLWKAIIKNNANPIFVWQSIIQPETKDCIRSIASGTSGSMKNISKTKFLNIPVKNASIEEQNRFANYVTQINEERNIIEKSIVKMQLLFDSLMQEYFG